MAILRSPSPLFAGMVNAGMHFAGMRGGGIYQQELYQF